VPLIRTQEAAGAGQTLQLTASLHLVTVGIGPKHSDRRRAQRENNNFYLLVQALTDFHVGLGVFL
jgi:hypothetical protein